MPHPYYAYSPLLKIKMYDFIVKFKLEHNGDSPTIREIGEAVGLSSTGTVSRHLDRMVLFGMIERKRHMISVVGGYWQITKVKAN